MIECNDVIKIYADPETNTRVAALRGIDLHIKKGELVSIIGPSGSGKSTLIKIFAGMEAISSGDVRIGEYQLGKMTLEELLAYRLNTVGLVHQFPERTLFLSGTVMDNLMFAAGLCSTNISENKRRNKEILEKLQMSKLANRRVSYLSGGEMIRTAIGCILAKNAPLLLCDEPTGQLDSVNTQIVKDILREISREYQTTVLVVTHDLRFLKGVDRTCEMHSGRVSSLFSADVDLKFEKQHFPLEFNAQIDSSQNIRIPNEIFKLMKLGNNLKFEVSEDSNVVIKHPDGIPPKKIEIKELQKKKTLKITPLPEKYFGSKELDISLRNASKIYGTKNIQVAAASNVDLDIHKGEFAFIIGPSGSGKTTIIKLLTGMVESSEGEVNVLNQPLHNFNDTERAKFRQKNIGIVSQQGDLHPFMTVQENLFVKDILAGKTILVNDYPETEITSIFDQFQITHRKNSFPLEISGGELQRASLAIAQFGSPRILILDEPTANMDSELADNVMTQLYELHRQLKVTLLITTHDINLVRDGTRVIDLKDGKINKDGLALSIEE
ncbi:MAG: ABC transporter ATP-binding protein [Candidatus Heimdallarchaeota archaeon]